MSANTFRGRAAPQPGFARRLKFIPTRLALACGLAVAAGSAHAQQAEAAAPASAASAPSGAASAPSAPTESTLAPVKVSAARELDATTEGSRSYAAPAATLGKGQHSQRELPNSMTVITREQLTDQNVTTIEGALKYVPGVTIQRYDATGTYTQFMARGYAADAYQLDGLTLQTDANGIYFDLYGYDRVEVQRGTASLFTGAGEPGITVNMARKRALPTFAGQAAVSASSWNDYRVEGDVSSALNEAGSLRGRVAAVAQNYDTYMDGIDDNRKRMAYGTLELDIADRTTLSVGATWQKVNTVLSRGLPTWANAQLIDMPRSTMPIQSWNWQTLESSSVFAELEHRGTDESLFKVALRQVDRTNEANYLDPSVPAADGTMSALSASAFARDDKDQTLDVYYSTPFQVLGRKHNLLVGADYRRTKNLTDYAGYITLPGATLNLFRYEPDRIPEPSLPLVPVGDVRITSYGTYGQVRFQALDSLMLIAGGRVGSYFSEGSSYGTPANFSDTGEFVPYVAAIQDIAPGLSAYTSYGTIFKPQNARTEAGEQIAPREGRQIELGLKGEIGEGRFIWSAAAYLLEDVNRAVAIANTPYSEAAGEARSSGFEIEAHGEVGRGWSVSGGYAYTDTEYKNDIPSRTGTPLSTFTPRHAATLWTLYRVAEGPLNGLKLGAGANSKSSFSNGTGRQKVTGPGYTVFNVMAAYPLNKQLELALNVDNLFDKVYWEKVSSPGRQNFFGEPRRITLALRGNF